MITAIMWLIPVLSVLGLILIIYGNTNDEPFCFYIGIGIEMIVILVLLLTLLTLLTL